MKAPVGIALVGLGAIAAGLGAVFIVLRGRDSLPSSDWQTFTGSYSEADVEAAARMLASENPNASQSLHVEQVYAMLRAREPGQSLFDYLTKGHGFGVQGEHGRPASTMEPATQRFRRLARQILDGELPSRLTNARRWFEPEQQDAVFAIAERARQRQKVGQPLTKREQRLLRYKKDAAAIRRDWSRRSSRLATIDGCEFYT